MPEQEPKHKRQILELFSIFKEDNPILKFVHFILREGRGIKEGRWVIMPLVILVIVATYWLSGYWIYSPRIDNLKDELSKSNRARDEAERDRDKYQIELIDEQNAQAPLRAITNLQNHDQTNNNDLIKPFDVSQPFVKAKITVQIIIVHKGDPDYSSGDLVPYSAPPPNRVTLIDDFRVLLSAGAWALEMNQVDSNHEEYYFIANSLSADSTCVGKPLIDLNGCDNIRIDVGLANIPDGTSVIGGKVVVLLNSSILLRFDIPPQQTYGGCVSITDLENGLSPLRHETGR